MTKTQLVGLISLSALLLTGCSNAAEPTPAEDGTSSVEHVKVAYTTPAWNPEMAPFAVADALGFFEEEGVTWEIALSPSGSESSQQVISGQADISYGNAESATVAQARGEDLRYFMPFYGHFIFQLAELPDWPLNSVEDLEGARIGVSAATSAAALYTRTLLEEAGLSGDSVSFVPIGVGPQQFAAIQNGEVDALAFWDTQYVSMQLNGIELEVKDFNKDATALFGGGVMAMGDKMSSNPDKFVRWGRAMAKAWVWTAAYPEEAIEIFWESRPEAGPASGTDRGVALENQAAVLSERMKWLVHTDDTSFLEMSEGEADAYTSWAKQAGIVDVEIPGADIMNFELTSQIADFDAEEIRSREVQ